MSQFEGIAGLGAGGGVAHGSVAARMLQSGFNVNALRTQGTLRKDEWIEFDSAVVQVARKRLIGVQDLMDAGLVWDLPNALGTTRVEWERISDMEAAAITMSGISQSQNDRVVFDLKGLPVPIIHKDFNINVRVLEASRRSGQPLDVTQAQVATRKVVESIESMLFNGATVLGSNNPIYGYRTVTNRNTGSLTATWATATGAQIVANVMSMMDALTADNQNGPFVLYIGRAAGVNFGNDYKADSDKTIMQRVMEIPGISAVRVTQEIASTEAIMVSMTSDTVQMIDGIQPTVVEWESHGGFVVNFKVLAIMLPRIRDDYLNQSGIAHFSV